MFKLCVIYNAAPQYREAIFRAIDACWNCDWYFGHTDNDIREMDTSLLRRVHYYKRWGSPNRLYWQRGIIQLLFRRDYYTFLMLAESRCLSNYVFFALARLLFPNKRVYVWTHGWYGKESALEAKFKKWMFRQVDGIFVYGNYAKELMIRQNLPHDRIFVIHNSLHYDRQLLLRKELKETAVYRNHFNNDKPTLIFIGRLTFVKRLDLLIDAVSSLHKKGEHYNIVFVGDGEMRSNLEKQVEKLNLKDYVWFYGECYDEYTNAQLIYNAEICVAPGNVGLTAMHSMVFGTPVITHNDFKWQMPEFEAIHPGITGDFFEQDSVESLAKCISRWFQSNHLRREVVRKACYHEIDTQWTPQFQLNVLKKNIKI